LILHASLPRKQCTFKLLELGIFVELLVEVLAGLLDGELGGDAAGAGDVAIGLLLLGLPQLVLFR